MFYCIYINIQFSYFNFCIYIYIIGAGQKKIIINLYKDKLKQQAENPDNPRLTYRKIILEICKASGIGQKTIQKTSEYKSEGTVSSPSKKRNK